MTTEPEVAAEIQKLAPSAEIVLFEIDLTTLGDSLYRFHGGTNQLQQALVWQGETYDPWPVQASGFDYNTTGQLPRPKMVIGNVLGTITALVLALNDCIGGKVTRKRTLLKFLDAVNFPGGVNPTADPDAELPDEIYFIDRKASETGDAVEFELTAAFDVSGVKLPRRQIIQNLCTWRYRGGECGYAGPPIASADDTELGIADATTPAELTYIGTRDAYRASLTAVTTTLAALETANNAVNEADDFVLDTNSVSVTAPRYFVLDETRAGARTPTVTAYYNNTRVTLGATYRRGVQYNTSTNQDTGEVTTYYYIQRWTANSAAQAAAAAAQATAQANYDAAIATRDAAIVALDAAIAALPPDSPMVLRDICGKRIASCKMRFGETGELPFGGFPGAGLVSG